MLVHSEDLPVQVPEDAYKFLRLCLLIGRNWGTHFAIEVVLDHFGVNQVIHRVCLVIAESTLFLLSIRILRAIGVIVALVFFIAFPQIGLLWLRRPTRDVQTFALGQRLFEKRQRHRVQQVLPELSGHLHRVVIRREVFFGVEVKAHLLRV